MQNKSKEEALLKISTSPVSGCRTCAEPFATAENVIHQLAESLGTAIDAKDPYTSLHSEEVAEVSHAIALSYGLPSNQADIIHVAGHLHDIGKIGVPDQILKKEGPLTDTEWVEIKKHPDKGAEILKPVGCLVDTGIVEMVRHHHERFDGKGYPSGLKGEAIPVGARIIALADTISAILQNRPYRPAQNFDHVLEEIRRCSGSQFDPTVVEAFLSISEEVKSILQYLCPGSQVA